MNKNIKNALLLGAVVTLVDGAWASGSRYNPEDLDTRGTFKSRLGGTLRQSESSNDLHAAADAEAQKVAADQREATYTSEYNKLAGLRVGAAKRAIQAERNSLPKIPALTDFAAHDRLFVAKTDTPNLKKSDDFKVATIDDLKAGAPIFVKHATKDEWAGLDLDNDSASKHGIKSSDVKAFLKTVTDAEDAHPTWAAKSNDALVHELYGLNAPTNPYSFDPNDVKWAEHKKLYDGMTKSKPAAFTQQLAAELEPVVAFGAKYGFRAGKPLDAMIHEAFANAGSQDQFITDMEPLFDPHKIRLMSEAEYDDLQTQGAMVLQLKGELKKLKAAGGNTSGNSSAATTTGQSNNQGSSSSVAAPIMQQLPLTHESNDPVHTTVIGSHGGGNNNESGKPAHGDVKAGKKYDGFTGEWLAESDWKDKY